MWKVLSSLVLAALAGLALSAAVLHSLWKWSPQSLCRQSQAPCDACPFVVSGADRYLPNLLSVDRVLAGGGSGAQDNNNIYSFVTLNSWGTTHWTSRRQAIQNFVAKLRPDILVVQEMSTAMSHAVLEGGRSGAVEYEEWTQPKVHSSVFWNRAKFKAIRRGTEDVGINGGKRRLVWVELETLQRTVFGESKKRIPKWRIVAATAHLTWQGGFTTLLTPIDPRKKQAAMVGRVLNRFMWEADNDEIKSSEPEIKHALLFAGDLNCPFFSSDHAASHFPGTPARQFLRSQAQIATNSAFCRRYNRVSSRGFDGATNA